MKRSIVLLITAALAFALCACTEAAPSGIENQTANPSASGNAAENAADADNAEERTGDGAGGSGSDSAEDGASGSAAGNDAANATDSAASASSDNVADNAALTPGISPGGTYWKVSWYDAEGISTDEFRASLFLWTDGAGYFTFSQASEESGYYGFRDAFDCKWVCKGSTLTLTGAGSTPAVKYTGVFEQDQLTILYDGFIGETIPIIMEQAEMPPYGSQWDVPDLFGTWRMISFTDHFNGTVVSDNGIYNVFNDEMYVYSEISVFTTLQADYLLENSYDFGEARSDLSVKRFSGELWNGCGNEAWYVELAGKGEIGEPSFYASFADGKLLFMKNVGYDAFSFSESFIAEYERLDVDLQYDWHEWREWIGDYSFHDSDSSGSELAYSISIAEHPEWGVLTAQIIVEGSEAEMTLQAAVIGNANYIELTFSGYGSGDFDPASFGKLYRNNEIILTLTRNGSEVSVARVS